MRLRKCVGMGHPLRRHGVCLDTATQIVRDFCDSLVECMQNGESVLLPGLGKLEIVNAPSNTTRDPRTGKEVTYVKIQRVRFAPNAALRRSLRVKKLDSCESGRGRKILPK